MKKQNLPLKICPVCKRFFFWRKKWRFNWDKVKYCSNLTDLKNCHILLISSSKNGAINQINKNVDKQTLMVSESSNMASSGAIINFIFKDSKLKFELNKTKAEQHQLKVGQNLTKLAYKII